MLTLLKFQKGENSEIYGIPENHQLTRFDGGDKISPNQNLSHKIAGGPFHMTDTIFRQMR